MNPLAFNLDKFDLYFKQELFDSTHGVWHPVPASWAGPVFVLLMLVVVLSFSIWEEYRYVHR